MIRPASPAQGVLFGRQSVHVGRYAPSPSLRTCVLCAVLLALSAAWDDCDSCPGLVEPAPSWWVLGEAGLDRAEAA